MNTEDVKSLCTNIVGLTNNFYSSSNEHQQTNPPRCQIFRRDSQCLVFEGDQIKIPHGHMGLRAEIHFGVIIEIECSECPKEKAMDFVTGYVAVLNTRLRNSNYEAKGRAIADTHDFPSCVAISPIIHKKFVEHPHACTIWASANGAEFQRAPLTDMVKTIPELIEHVSRVITLTRGDLLLCGTSTDGIDVQAGDVIEMGIENTIRCVFPVVKFSEVQAAEPTSNNFIENKAQAGTMLDRDAQKGEEKETD
ncbi:fumarylacetoacetate (FAA) hydrolase family domain-containing protein [Ditylenchus destructor]|nr:fumarylacetoacetate (FAA) hydrolase family domain-containing protein [Ditylenchus destructor]